MSTTTAPRIRPVEQPYPDDAAALLARMPGRPGQEPLALFRTFVRNVPMTKALNQWGGYELGPGLSVGLRERELVIDRVCARCGCEYEWGVHIAAFAEQAGLSPEQRAATATASSDDPVWSPTDALLIGMVDELHDTATVSDALWSALAEHWSAAQILDLLALAGWYHAICYIANGARVPLESWAARFPEAGR
jgi:4-carboxymuconolactone decarboxylase